MPPKRSSTKQTGSPVPGEPRAVRCKAVTTSGNPCRKRAVTGLTVCDSHGGGTAASVGKSKKVRASQRAAQLWGISADTSGVSVVDELNKLSRNKLTDILALRIELGSDPDKYYGLLVDSKDITKAEVGEDILTTIKQTRKSGVHPLVMELHKAENELVQILRLLHEVSGTGSSEQDIVRVRMQTARETARLVRAFPGMAIEDIAAEVAKRA